MKLFKKIFIITLCLILTFPAAAASAATYTVAKNDSVYSLSQLFNCSQYLLRSSNNFNVNSFSVGDNIFVPAHIHIVKSGESLHSIATKYGITLTSIKKANYKTGTSIVPGEKILIPGVKPKLKTDSVIPYSGNEVSLLAKLIEAEAAGESLKAKVAVGAVVINRVQSGDWAPTIRKVIYQKFGEYYQFTPVKIGTINNTPSAESKRAAWLAMYGADPSMGAIYYFDQTSTNQWLWSKTKTASIDHMIFVK